MTKMFSLQHVVTENKRRVYSKRDVVLYHFQLLNERSAVLKYSRAVRVCRALFNILE